MVFQIRIILRRDVCVTVCVFVYVFYRINFSEHGFVYVSIKQMNPASIIHIQCFFNAYFSDCLLSLCYFVCFSANNFQQDETSWNFRYIFIYFRGLERLSANAQHYHVINFEKKGLKMRNWFKYVICFQFSSLGKKITEIGFVYFWIGIF